MANHLNWKSELRTHVGNVRKHNEDAALARDAGGLWAVADGMGGHHAGEVASQKIVEQLDHLPLRAYLVDVVEQIEDALIKTNDDLLAYAQQELNGSKVGSTVACLFVRYGVAVAVWAGDSRVYLMRNHKLHRITHDHSKVQELVDKGDMTPAQAEQSSFRNMLTRAVGVHEHLCVDVNAILVEPSDRFLICTDGLYNEVGEDGLAKAMQIRSLSEAADTLLKETLNGDAKDNVTFIALQAH
ncbi:serine/threonine-protein phosphatase [Hahella sp. KA22]|uniref:PP2C family protein-serine/threonine phosphatase n=1 Tax=Hahella sp. KA22 TaxID=1628392 RepID=UPI000FDDF61C|nr:protein phosphatase 2C domain-containing protein [Hahella sp. KA22]AZZ93189.1 serine/threonine-protein phosphatase [Hahella sp. KA22]QAY56562.1 serine/threonine-protein phosphatase [Hahella sp. KA22]